MTHAYERTILDYVAGNVGSMLQTATCVYAYQPQDFLYMFRSSKVAHGIEDASPKYLVGMSGVELFWQVVREKEGREANSCPWGAFGYGADYWTGWTLARYQWHSGRTFNQILKVATYDDFLSLYPTLHEAPDEKSLETLDAWFARRPSSIKLARERRGLTQEELAQESGVSVNTIRAYERKAKDPARARYDIIEDLAFALKIPAIELVD
jgi:DNA-binding XRE family transcriptional regulator